MDGATQIFLLVAAECLSHMHCHMAQYLAALQRKQHVLGRQERPTFCVSRFLASWPQDASRPVSLSSMGVLALPPSLVGSQ